MMSKHIQVDIVTITTKLIRLILDFGNRHGFDVKLVRIILAYENKYVNNSWSKLIKLILCK